MSQIQVQLLTGPDAGKRRALSSWPITFGRETGNTLVLDGRFVSRQHGQIALDADQWLLVNQSQNGTEVNGKPVKSKPVALRQGDTVSVGGEAMFQVVTLTVAPAGASELPPEPAADEAAPQSAAPHISRKTKLWIGIGVYLVLMLGLMVFFKTLKSDKDTTIQTAPRLSREQIAQEIRKPLPPVQVDPLRAQAALMRARERLDQKHVSADALFHAHRAFQEALQYSGRDTFAEGIDQRRYQDAQQELIEKVTRLYDAAYTYFKAGNFDQAVEAFQEVKRHYPDTTSRIFSNCDEQRGRAKTYARQVRRR